MDSDASATPPPTPAGWYSDPDSGKLRWWDGTRWTDAFAEQAIPPPLAVPTLIAVQPTHVPIPPQIAEQFSQPGIRTREIKCLLCGWLGPVLVERWPWWATLWMIVPITFAAGAVVRVPLVALVTGFVIGTILRAIGSRCATYKCPSCHEFLKEVG